MKMMSQGALLLGIFLFVGGACGEDCTSELYQHMQGYMKVFSSPNISDVYLNMCSSTGRTAIQNWYTYFDNCTDMKTSYYPTLVNVSLAKAMNSSMDAFCAIFAGNCSVKALQCNPILTDTASLASASFSGFSLDKMYEFLPELLSHTCSVTKPYIACVMEALEDCPEVKTELETMDSKFSKLTGFQSMSYLGNLEYLEELCALKTGNENCAKASLASQTFANCFNSTGLTQTGSECQSFTERCPCFNAIKDQGCGDSTTRFLIAGLPVVYDKIPNSCGIDYLQAVKNSTSICPS